MICSVSNCSSKGSAFSYIADDAPPSERGNTGPHTQAALDTVIVEVGEGHSRLHDRICELIIDFYDFVHPM